VLQRIIKRKSLYEFEKELVKKSGGSQRGGGSAELEECPERRMLGGESETKIRLRSGKRLVWN